MYKVRKGERMKVISLPEIVSRIRCRRSGKTFLTEFINQCKIEDAIIIPEGATNGDAIKAIFDIPDSEIDEGLSTTYIYTSKQVLKGGSQDLLRKQITFSKDWWNAPYKGNLSEKPTSSESEG